MPRKPNIEPGSRLNLVLTETLRARVDLLLFSELEGRVPQGAYQEFFSARIREFFDHRRLDLSPWGIPGMISGPKSIIEMLERKLGEAR